MKTEWIVGILSSIIGGITVYYFIQHQDANAAEADPVLTGGVSQSFQPQNDNPFKAAVPPRVDNESQPWYGGDRSGMAQSGAFVSSYDSMLASLNPNSTPM